MWSCSECGSRVRHCSKSSDHIPKRKRRPFSNKYCLSIYWSACWHISSIIHKMLDWNLSCVTMDLKSTLPVESTKSWSLLLSHCIVFFYMLYVYLNFCLFSRPVLTRPDMFFLYFWKVNMGDQKHGRNRKRVQRTESVSLLGNWKRSFVKGA